MHLLTDYLFYNRYIETWSTDIYNDYDILNQPLIDKYRLYVPEKARNNMLEKKSNELKLLSMPLVDKLIKEVSIMDIDKIIKEVQEEPEKWTSIRPLKKI